MWDIISAKEPQASNKAKSLCNTVLWILRYPDYQNYVYSMLFGILSALSVWKIIFFQVKPKQKRPGSWWPLSLWHSVNKYSVKKCAVDLLYFDIFNLKGHTLDHHPGRMIFGQPSCYQYYPFTPIVVLLICPLCSFPCAL